MKLRADEVLIQMAETFRSRNSEYGDNWITVGKVFAALFPEGLELKTEADWIAFHWLSWIVGKLTRFTNSNMQSLDSLHDIVVYGAMLETFLRSNHQQQLERKTDDDKK